MKQRGHCLGRPIEIADSWIAATALLYRIPLITRNHCDVAFLDHLDLVPVLWPCDSLVTRFSSVLMDQRNFTFMFFGFAAAWLILALYVVSLVSRGRKLQDQLETLKRTLSQEKV